MDNTIKSTQIRFFFVISNILLLIILLLGFFESDLLIPSSVQAAVSSAPLSNIWQTGASINPTSTTEFGTPAFQQSIANLHSTGANYVTLVVTYYQANDSSTTMAPGWNTPTDASLVSGINYIHSLGMHVMLKFHLEAQPYTWRAYINPTDKAAWFTSYTSYINHYAVIAQQTNVEDLCLGVELISMTTYTSSSANTNYWISLIQSVRSIYSGKLTYDANGATSGFNDEMDHIGFWSYLDYVGISAYFDLTSKSDPSVTELETGWANYLPNVQNLHNTTGKNIVFTEIGYRSISGSNGFPWDYTRSGTFDELEQANDYTALFTYWQNYSWMKGVELWNWSSNPSYGGNGNTDYTPQNKQAQTVMTNFFGGIQTTPTVSPTVTPSITPTQTPVPTATPTVMPTNTPTPTTVPTSTPTVTPTSIPTPTSTPVPTTIITPSVTPIVTPVQSYSFGISSGTIAPSIGYVNSQMTLGFTVTNKASALSNGIIDLEVYDSNNKLIYQVFVQNQSLDSLKQQVYTFLWTPKSIGSYRVAVGIFSQNWKMGYNWSNNVINFTVIKPNITPTPEQYILTIVNPTSTKISAGAQKFSANVNGLDLNSYDIFWQVNGGELNKMPFTLNGKYKVTYVNVSHWNKNGKNILTFIAKDKKGNIIAQNTMNVSIQNKDND